MLIATSIFVVTLVLVIWQSRGLGVGWSAAGGGTADGRSQPWGCAGCMAYSLERDSDLHCSDHHQFAA